MRNTTACQNKESIHGLVWIGHNLPQKYTWFSEMVWKCRYNVEKLDDSIGPENLRVSLSNQGRNLVTAPSFHHTKLPWVILNGLILLLVHAARKMSFPSQQACNDIIRQEGRKQSFLLVDMLVPSLLNWHRTSSLLAVLFTHPQSSMKTTTLGTSIAHNNKMTLFKLWTGSVWTPVVKELKQKR